jgi:uncharacterized protein
MKLDGEYLFDSRVQDVWDALFDPSVLAAVLPGCEKLDLVDGKYVGDIKVKVGPIQGKFTGKVDLLDKVEPTSYRMIIDGRGQQGFVNATANIALAAEGEQTRIRYTSESQIGGKIASVGQRLVETSAKAIVKQSLEGLNENIKLRVAAFAAHARATPEAPPPVVAAPAVAAPAVAAPAVAARGVEAPGVEAPAAPPPAVEASAAPPPVVEASAAPPPVAEASAAPPPVVEASAAPPPVAAPVVTAPLAPPVVEYKRADVGKLGAAVAKEVAKTYALYIVLAVVVIGAILYLALR